MDYLNLPKDMKECEEIARGISDYAPKSVSIETIRECLFPHLHSAISKVIRRSVLRKMKKMGEQEDWER